MAPDGRGADGPEGEVTALLGAARRGDPGAADRLFRAVYDDLKRIARRQLGSAGERATLTPTALVHEAYLRLARPGNLDQNDRTHFFAVAARAMRQVAIDHARQKLADKRGGGGIELELVEARDLAAGRPALAGEDLLALDRALDQLERIEPRLARVVEWRFFAGLPLEEIAVMAAVSERTLKRDWRKARAFLYRELSGDAPAPAG